MGLCAGVCAGSRKGGGGKEREPQLNRALVFVKPHAQTALVRDLVRDHLHLAAFTIEGEGEILAEDIDKRQLVDKHYYSIASKATIMKPEQLNVPTSMFHDKFKEKWEDVLKQGRAKNAAQACETLGLKAHELDAKWREVQAKGQYVKLGGGFYCGKFEADGKPLYIFNPFFMAMRAKFTAPGASIYYFAVAWPADSLAWSAFRDEVLGATDPVKAVEGSMRRTIFDRWQELGLSSAPDNSDNGVHGSASPFEGLGERTNWLSQSLGEDPFGMELLARGLDEPSIKEWTQDPQVKVTWQEQGSLFDALEGLDADACIERLSDLYVINRLRNSALLFIKPHAQTASARVLVRKMLEAAGIDVVGDGTITGPQIHDCGLVDAHYDCIASKAMRLHPDELVVTAEAFQAKFKEAWAGAVKAGHVLNAEQACSKFGINAHELEQRWTVCDHKNQVVKLGRGCYCGRIEGDGNSVYVINGFYPAARERFMDPQASIYYLSLSWAPELLTWKRFRTNVVGATDPKQALPGSLRRLFIDQWQDLGLAQEPTVAHNGLHASASPLEGAVEHSNWLEMDLKDPPFCRLLRQRGLSSEQLERFLKDSEVLMEGKPSSAFEAVEDLDVVPCMERLLRLAGASDHPHTFPVVSSFEPAPRSVPAPASAPNAATPPAATAAIVRPVPQTAFGAGVPAAAPLPAEDRETLDRIGSDIFHLIDEATATGNKDEHNVQGAKSAVDTSPKAAFAVGDAPAPTSAAPESAVPPAKAGTLEPTGVDPAAHDKGSSPSPTPTSVAPEIAVPPAKAGTLNPADVDPAAHDKGSSPSPTPTSAAPEIAVPPAKAGTSKPADVDPAAQDKGSAPSPTPTSAAPEIAGPQATAGSLEPADVDPAAHDKGSAALETKVDGAAPRTSAVDGDVSPQVADQPSEGLRAVPDTF